MSAREVPRHRDAVLWSGAGHWYKTRYAAYYAIAKALIVAKYPPEIGRAMEMGSTRVGSAAAAEGEPSELEIADSLGMTVTQLRARSDRMADLFFTDRDSHDGQPGGYFDTRRWCRVVHRVARFLQFVDRRRAAALQPRCPACNCALKTEQAA